MGSVRGRPESLRDRSASFSTFARVSLLLLRGRLALGSCVSEAFRNLVRARGPENGHRDAGFRQKTSIFLASKKKVG